MALLAVVLFVGCGSARTENYSDGSRYTGEFRDAMHHGQGILTWPDGSWHTGEFKDGELVDKYIYGAPILAA